MATLGWIIGAAAVLAATVCDAQSVDIMRYYPERAQRLGVEGKAVISCTVNAEGRLADCAVVSEDPPGFGFGDAAVKMSSIFKMRPKAQNGIPVGGGKVTIPIRFQLPKDAPPPAAVPAPAPKP
ncbi:energy transducer TonB [Caulobacter sp. KR2-114]|uniref:energy transducer TonB n=1 Tax=Caulobacter sp. KR2-114 TaxID=3400912 RepID=UPI003C0C13C5